MKFEVQYGVTEAARVAPKNVYLYFKESYGRTAGIPMNCKNDEEEDAGLFLNLILKIKIIYLLTLLFSRTVLYTM